MIRTQVYLPEDLYNDLKLLANTSKTKFSDLLREGARLIIKKKNKQAKSVDAWKNFIGAYKGKLGKSGVELIKEYYEKDVV